MVLKETIETDGDQELDDKRNDDPVWLVRKADTVDEDLDCDEDQGDKPWILDVVSSDGEEHSQEGNGKCDPHVVLERNNCESHEVKIIG